MMALLVSCGSGGLKGTYLPKNCAAKQNFIAKFEFQPEEEYSFFDKGLKKNTVKVYVGIMGVTLPMAQEYTYSLKGDKIIFEEGIPGINGQSYEFTYNKAQDEISVNLDFAFDILGGMASLIGNVMGNENVDGNEVSNELKNWANKDDVAPKWGKEGSVPKDPCATPTNENKQGFNQKLAEPELTKEPPTQAEDGKEDKEDSWNYKPYTFYQTLAEDCAVYSSEVYHKPYIVEHLKKDGYTVSNYYDNKDENGIGYILAHKAVNKNEILLAVVIRGTDGEEWKGNMNIGKNSERHESFENANAQLQKAINEYIGNNKNVKNKNINLLITGHSRGAAVGNLLAVDSKESKWCNNANIKNVYAYLFATPNNSKNFSKDGYENIFNFCFEDDFVTQVPLKKWGYGKSGKTYIAVATGLYCINSDFKKMCDNDRNSYNNAPYFNYYAVKQLLEDVHEIAETVTIYYDKKLKMGMHAELKLGTWVVADVGEKDKTLHEFMRDYVAQATIDMDGGKKLLFTQLPESSALYGLGAKAYLSAGNDVHKIADFFIDVENLCAEKYIWDTHVPATYSYALKTNGFLTK